MYRSRSFDESQIGGKPILIFIVITANVAQGGSWVAMLQIYLPVNANTNNKTQTGKIYHLYEHIYI